MTPRLEKGATNANAKMCIVERDGASPLRFCRAILLNVSDYERVALGIIAPRIFPARRSPPPPPVFSSRLFWRPSPRRSP